MNTENKQPTDEQIAAIGNFAQRHGRYWKRALNECWMTGLYHGDTSAHLLQQVRNQFGPTWLMKFKLVKG